MFVELNDVSLYLPGSKKYANKKITKNNGGLNFLERFVGNKFLALKNLNLKLGKRVILLLMHHMKKMIFSEIIILWDQEKRLL